MDHPSDVIEIAAFVSEKICNVFPSYTKVGHVHKDGRTIELDVNGSSEPIGCDVDRFWPSDCTLSDERKLSLFWQYHRSMGCNQYVAVLATVLKGLSDNGVQLMHNGDNVVDILVLNTTEFDVSDLLGNECLRVHDPVSNTSIPSIATHETMDRLIELGEAVINRLGMQSPSLDDGQKNTRDTLKQHRPESYTGAVPHWWLAVVVEGMLCGEKNYYMVHLDMCGAAYVGNTALVEAPNGGNMTSLQVFSTPEYEMIPNISGPLKHKLAMKAITSKRCYSTIIQGGAGKVVLQPKSIRHFRCYHKNDTSSIEVTPLLTYLEQYDFGDDKSAKISEMVSSIQQEVILKLSVGSKVTVCNIKSKPELNGRFGVVSKSSGKDKIPIDRVPIKIEGQKAPLALRTMCIQLPASKNRQYQTLEEKINEYNKLYEDDDEYKKEMNSSLNLTPKQKSNINLALSDPDVVKALSVIQTGQVTFTSYGDASFKRGIGKFLKPPLLDAVLPKSMTKIMRSGYELSEHPKANDAIKLINLRKAGKQRLLSSDDGDYSELIRIETSIVQRIGNDAGLNYVFDRLEELGLYANPTRQNLLGLAE